MQPAFFWIWLFIHSNTTQAKHTIETAYSGKRTINLCAKSQLYTKSK